METVTTAAIRVNGEIWTLPRPARHHILMRAWSHAHWDPKAMKPSKLPKHEQGFMTSEGRFVDRREAAKIATAAKQLHGRHREEEVTVLTSEHLW